MRSARPLAILVLAVAAETAAGADAARGKVLYETHCGGCHYEKLHKRQSSPINSIAALKLEVVKWSRQTGRSFAVQELDDIAEHLNRTHYRLEK